jgi:pSer/pThr/pTyr-binding forkhead associated (FHA) protein
MELVLELLKRNGKVESFHKISGDQASIGRAYNNDIVISNQFICPNHLSIKVQDGKVWIKDNNSVNGVSTEKNVKIEEDIPIELGQRFVIGNQAMRVVSSDQNINATVKMTWLESLSQRLNYWYWGLASLVIAYVFLVGKKYLNHTTEMIWSKLLIDETKVLIVTLVASLIIAGIALIIKKENRLFLTLSFAFAGIILIILTETIPSVWRFNLGNAMSTVVIGEIYSFATFIITVWAAFYLTTHFSYKKITVVSATLVISGQALYLLYKHSGDEVNTQVNHSVQIYPKALLFVSPKPTDEWLEKNTDLYMTSKKEAQKRNKASDAK